MYRHNNPFAPGEEEGVRRDDRIAPPDRPMGMSGGALEQGEEFVAPSHAPVSDSRTSPSAGERAVSGMGGSRPDSGLPSDPPQAGPAGNEEARAYEDGTEESESPPVEHTGTESIARQDASLVRNQALAEDLQTEGEERRMGTGGGRSDVGLPRQHTADGPQEVRETEADL